MVLLIEPDKDFGYQIVCVGGVVQVAPRKSEERFLPPGHQAIQRGVITLLEGTKVGVVVVGGGSH